jgi:hypothetical protein
MLTAMASVCRKVAAWLRECHGVSFTCGLFHDQAAALLKWWRLFTGVARCSLNSCLFIARFVWYKFSSASAARFCESCLSDSAESPAA